MKCSTPINCPEYVPPIGKEAWMKRFCAKSITDDTKYMTCPGDSGGRIFPIIDGLLIKENYFIAYFIAIISHCKFHLL